MSELESKILEMVKERHVRTGGNNGYALAQLRYDLDIELSVLTEALDNLEKTGSIVYRIGSATKLIMWKAS